MKFDGIISNNVLDHMQDPIGTLKLMKSLLKSNASMIHASDGFDYNIPYTKAHLYFFVGKSVDYITKNIGMSYEQIPYNLNTEIKIVKWKN
jgi:2-polyprenyl-3-methyl-5-hydroxy-6-metoxy-1,4-benzoquinol methylase